MTENTAPDPAVDAPEEEFVPAPEGEQGDGELNPGEPADPYATGEVGDDAAVDENGDELPDAAEGS